ncbi:Adaptive-response sensory-kinase SasA [Paraburkholderia caffeinitolerans]|uniref:histidine kinase n=1 Tax=Paraburkholderia caffeinitolerans TaxID=1723730 RepID=A0A6J5GUW3_9BURK|nr:Adaptive-response sensory-kinase SasA [Paraburkholderia caffeinitolerans]
MLAWLVFSFAGTVFVVEQSVADVRARFLQDSSIAIRLLGQRAAQHEAILATLGAAPLSASPAQVLENLHASMPQLTGLAFWRPASGWVGANASTPSAPPAHAHAGQVSLTFDGASAYWLIGSSGWAVRVDAQQLLQAGDWPASLSSATLRLHSRAFNLLQRTAADAPFGWTLHLEKHLPARPQDFVLLTTRTLRAADLPWLAIVLWNTVCALIAAAALGTWRLRQVRRRETARARLDRFDRLDTFGEMAAGLAHELNQPLTAIVSHARAAERLLDVPAERDDVRRALQTCVAQARRAAAILERLRGAVTSAHGGKRCALDPDALMNTLLFLYRDELAREHIALVWRNDAPRERPFAEQVAIEQILHNLIQNARAALKDSPRQGQRGEIRVSGGRAGRHYGFSVADNGPGVPAEALPHLFEPFFTTRPGGLGLGLPLCETLAQRQDGSLALRNMPEGGVEATLLLPLAQAPEGVRQ